MLNSGIADKLKKAQRAVMGSGDVKATQLEESMVAPDTKSRITSDFGVRQSNTDDWLRIATDDRTGPMLLEDPFAREKVGNPWWSLLMETVKLTLTIHM
jgi:catalase